MTRGEINQHWKNYFSVAVKGCIVGGTILVPGVSGGSMAVSYTHLDVYKRQVIGTAENHIEKISRVELLFQHIV